ncbi:hypothetical protein DOTSEDRAFT_37577 [Dothistroma septosporum NZE10]|uniref:Uncharacterized protein n=1 Tax=Dothistroma septosporum (strain NZE10 / CBS 128990) TaxID=675120 RepID=N1PEP0_DOTSN|nr:hypothetical protein DOTSEDRAFT_37577 [Dothistroma septosporum NZE10]
MCDEETGDLECIVPFEAVTDLARSVALRLEGDKDAFEILLFWLTKRCVPSHDIDRHGEGDDHQEIFTILINCWLIGASYQIRAFQDAVMLELLKLLGPFSVSLITLRHAPKQSRPGSSLRAVMLEELTWSIARDRFDHKDLAVLDDTPSLLSEYIPTPRRHSGHGEEDWGERVENGKWKKFLFGHGPPKHWFGRRETASGSSEEQD